VPGAALTATAEDSDDDASTSDGTLSPSAVVVAISGVSNYDDRQTLKDLVIALGGTYAEEVFGRAGAKPTHLVAEGSNVSPKILLALCLGIPIVRPAWLLASLSAGRWLPVDGKGDDGIDFFVAAFDKVSWRARQAMLYKRDPRMLADRPQRGPQFMTGIVLAFAGTSEYPGNLVFQELVQVVGGDVVRTSVTTALSAVVLMEPVPSPADLAQMNKRDQGRYAKLVPAGLDAAVPVVTPQWIIDSIARCAALPFDNYLAPHVRAPASASSPVEPTKHESPGADGTADTRLSTASAKAAMGGKSPATPQHSALVLALKKRSPGPASAVKEAAQQWSTQQLHQSPTQSSDDDSSD
jgi:hypothetical protein